MNGTSDVRSLDHFVVSVLDAEQAGANYEKLGFHVLPFMRHIELGSCNRVIQFKSTYLELIGDLDNAVHVHGNKMLKRFEVGEGLSIVSLSSENLDTDRERLQEDGFAPDAIVSARRKIDMPDGTANETDSSCFYVWRPDKEYLSLFYSAHYKPETIFVPEYYDNHPNTAKSVSGITYVSKAPSEDIDYFTAMFRSEPDKAEVDYVRFITPRGETLEIVAQDVLEKMQPGIDWSASTRLAGIPTGLSVKVDSLESCQRTLSINGVVSRRENGAISVDPAACNGVLFKFHE